MDFLCCSLQLHHCITVAFGRFSKSVLTFPHIPPFAVFFIGLVLSMNNWPGGGGGIGKAGVVRGSWLVVVGKVNGVYSLGSSSLFQPLGYNWDMAGHPPSNCNTGDGRVTSKVKH